MSSRTTAIPSNGCAHGRDTQMQKKRKRRRRKLDGNEVTVDAECSPKDAAATASSPKPPTLGLKKKRKKDRKKGCQRDTPGNPCRTVSKSGTTPPITPVGSFLRTLFSSIHGEGSGKQHAIHTAVSAYRLKHVPCVVRGSTCKTCHATPNLSASGISKRAARLRQELVHASTVVRRPDVAQDPMQLAKVMDDIYMALFYSAQQDIGIGAHTVPSPLAHFGSILFATACASIPSAASETPSPSEFAVVVERWMVEQHISDEATSAMDMHSPNANDSDLNPLLQYFHLRWLECALLQLSLKRKFSVVWKDNMRVWACHLWAYAVPTDAALDEVVRQCASFQCSGVVEVGAGTGYWAMLLRRKGIDVVASDCAPPSPHASSKQNSYHGRTKAWICDIVATDGASFLKRNSTDASHRALFLCYPPPNHPLAEQALAAYTGNVLFYVGEWQGLTGTRGFEKKLQRGWRLQTRVPLPNFGDTAYSLMVFVRQGAVASEEKTQSHSAPDSCYACTARAQGSRCELCRLDWCEPCQRTHHFRRPFLPCVPMLHVPSIAPEKRQ